MKRRVTPELSVGDIASCSHDPKQVVVHACKYPCFTNMAGKVSPGDEHYLAIESGSHLFLNVVDSPKPLFMLRTFEHLFDFLSRHRPQDALIHCNQGRSRSPGLAMAWLGHELGLGFDEARVLVGGALGLGIETFLRENWSVIRGL